MSRIYRPAELTSKLDEYEEVAKTQSLFFFWLQDMPSIQIGVCDFFLFFGIDVRGRKNGLSAGQDRSPHPECSVSQNRMVGVTQ